MVVETSPATPLVMAQSEVLFQVLVVALDAPALVDVNYLDRRASTIFAGGSGE